MATDFSHLFRLSTAEKLRLVEELWDDIATSGDPLPVPQWQADELRRRKCLRSEKASAGSSWQQVRERIQRERGA